MTDDGVLIRNRVAGGAVIWIVVEPLVSPELAAVIVCVPAVLRLVANDAVPFERETVPKEVRVGSEEVTVTDPLKLVSMVPFLSVALIVTLNEAPVGEDAGAVTINFVAVTPWSWKFWWSSVFPYTSCKIRLLSGVPVIVSG